MLLTTKRRTAMTLVEVVVAIAIAAIVSIGLYASAIYTMRQTSRNVEHMYALQIVNSAAAKVRAADFDSLTIENPDTLPADSFEKQFFSTHSVKADPAHGPSTSYTLTYNLKGFGKGIVKDTAGGGAKFDLVQSAASAMWGKDEFKDHLLVITGGKGANQVMYITKNNATHIDDGERTVKVWLDQGLDGKSGKPDFPTMPGASSMFAVDYGLYCEITVTWGDGEGHKTITETVYVPTS